MKIRTYFEGSIELEIPDALAHRLKVIDGAVGPLSLEESERIETTIVVLSAEITDRLHPNLAALEITNWSTVCRECGCTDDEGCDFGCIWVEPDLCSGCVPR